MTITVFLTLCSSYWIKVGLYKSGVFEFCGVEESSGTSYVQLLPKLLSSRGISGGKEPAFEKGRILWETQHHRPTFLELEITFALILHRFSNWPSYPWAQDMLWLVLDLLV